MYLELIFQFANLHTKHFKENDGRTLDLEATLYDLDARDKGELVLMSAHGRCLLTVRKKTLIPTSSALQIPKTLNTSSMSSDARCSIYIGNLDEKVTDKILYDILIQAGRVLDLHIPRDRDTDEPKGFAFAEYESEEVADYAVKLFSGLVTLYNRTLKFAISGQDKPLQNGGPNGLLSASNLLNKPRSHPRPNSGFETSHQTGFSTPRRESAYSFSGPIDPPGVVHHHNGYNGTNYDSGRRLFGSAVEAISGPRSHRYDSGLPYSSHR